MAETLILVHEATDQTQTISNEKGSGAWLLIFGYWFAPMLVMGNHLLGLTGIVLIVAVIYFDVAAGDNKAIAGCAVTAYLAIGTYVAFRIDCRRRRRVVPTACQYLFSL